MKQQKLPFKVGQLAESRSFVSGFRGAWFRCKIQEIGWRKGHLEYALEFFDFPDEKINWTRIYQVHPVDRKARDMRKQLMVRPQYPPICKQSEMPDANTVLEETIVANDVRKVGDYVDWWTDGCYWSGRVTEILNNGKVQVELPPPPLGEGSSYLVECKELRPSLDWSPECGWSVPTPEGENLCPCAQIIMPLNQAAGSHLNVEIHAVDLGANDVQTAAELPVNVVSSSSQLSASSVLPQEKVKYFMTKEMPGQFLNFTGPSGVEQVPEANIHLDIGDCSIGKTSCSDSVASSNIRDASTEIAVHTALEDPYSHAGPLKKIRPHGKFSLNSLYSDTLDAAVMDLEELANRVKWLKGMLEFGGLTSDTGRSSWKYFEYRASSMPK